MRRYHSIHQLVLLAALGLLCCSTDRVDDGGGDPTPTPTPPPAAADLRYPVVESDYMPSRQQTGDMIPDFSRVGYRWGDRAILDVAVVETLTPPSDGGDATALIQQAIDRTQSGAILLKRGVYRISGTIRINRSGIVLRGEGEGEDGTLLVAAGTTKRDLVVIGGSGSRRVESNTEAYDILDDYVPAGRFWVRSPRAGEFRVGDNVVVYRPSTREWISDLKMDQIPPRADGLPITQWEPGRFDTYAERVITLIKGDTLHFENPVVTSLHFGMGLVTMDQYAKNISVLDCTCLEPVSTLAGSRRYSFHISQGQLCLVKDCTSEDARHDYATGSLNCGPNVFTSCRAKRPHADIGPHQRWNTGTLYDCVISGGEICVQDRSNYDSGQGWAAGNNVLWNCSGSTVIVQSPWVSAYNYSVGTIGRKSPGKFNDPVRPDGVWLSPGSRVAPASLYDAQLELRRQSQPGGIMDIH